MAADQSDFTALAHAGTKAVVRLEVVMRHVVVGLVRLWIAYDIGGGASMGLAKAR